MGKCRMGCGAYEAFLPGGQPGICEVCRRNLEEDFKKALAARRREQAREEARE